MAKTLTYARALAIITEGRAALAQAPTRRLRISTLYNSQELSAEHFRWACKHVHTSPRELLDTERRWRVVLALRDNPTLSVEDARAVLGLSSLQHTRRVLKTLDVMLPAGVG